MGFSPRAGIPSGYWPYLGTSVFLKSASVLNRLKLCRSDLTYIYRLILFSWCTLWLSHMSKNRHLPCNKEKTLLFQWLQWIFCIQRSITSSYGNQLVDQRLRIQHCQPLDERFQGDCLEKQDSISRPSYHHLIGVLHPLNKSNWLRVVAELVPVFQRSISKPTILQIHCT